MNQTTRMSEQKTRRGQMAAGVNQLISVSSVGLGLIKLFLVNTNNINNHSVNVDNHKSDLNQPLYQNEMAVLYVDCFPRVTCFYHVIWPSSVQYPPLSDLVACVTWCVVGYLSSQNHSRYITSAHGKNRWQQTNSCTNKAIFLLHLTISIILQPKIGSQEIHHYTITC